MTNDRRTSARDVLEDAKMRLGERTVPLLDSLVQSGTVNLDWYLRKLLRADDSEHERDHRRVLKYAFNFARSGGSVTFLKEASDKTPDLRVETSVVTFYTEVKMFRPSSARDRVGSDPVSKIVDAVRKKSAQLPSGEIGFVAIDNFDIELEASIEGGLTHHHLEDAFNELADSAARSPTRWERPGGVIFSANTTGGAVSVPVNASISRPMEIAIPHLIWINEHSRPSVPPIVGGWVTDALPCGRLVDTAGVGTKDFQ